MHALSDDKPLRRYMVVPSEPEAAWAIDKVIQELVEFNQWQAYSYSREQLIEKLDAALNAAGWVSCWPAIRGKIHAPKREELHRDRRLQWHRGSNSAAIRRRGRGSPDCRYCD